MPLLVLLYALGLLAAVAEAFPYEGYYSADGILYHTAKRRVSHKQYFLPLTHMRPAALTGNIRLSAGRTGPNYVVRRVNNFYYPNSTTLSGVADRLYYSPLLSGSYRLQPYAGPLEAAPSPLFSPVTEHNPQRPTMEEIVGNKEGDMGARDGFFYAWDINNNDESTRSGSLATAAAGSRSKGVILLLGTGKDSAFSASSSAIEKLDVSFILLAMIEGIVRLPHWRYNNTIEQYMPSTKLWTRDRYGPLRSLRLLITQHYRVDIDRIRNFERLRRTSVPPGAGGDDDANKKRHKASLDQFSEHGFTALPLALVLDGYPGLLQAESPSTFFDNTGDDDKEYFNQDDFTEGDQFYDFPFNTNGSLTSVCSFDNLYRQFRDLLVDEKAPSVFAEKNDFARLLSLLSDILGFGKAVGNGTLSEISSRRFMIMAVSAVLEASQHPDLFDFPFKESNEQRQGRSIHVPLSIISSIVISNRALQSGLNCFKFCLKTLEDANDTPPADRSLYYPFALVDNLILDLSKTLAHYLYSNVDLLALAVVGRSFMSQLAKIIEIDDGDGINGYHHSDSLNQFTVRRDMAFAPPTPFSLAEWDALTQAGQFNNENFFLNYDNRLHTPVYMLQSKALMKMSANALSLRRYPSTKGSLNGTDETDDGSDVNPSASPSSMSDHLFYYYYHHPSTFANSDNFSASAGATCLSRRECSPRGALSVWASSLRLPRVVEHANQYSGWLAQKSAENCTYTTAGSPHNASTHYPVARFAPRRSIAIVVPASAASLWIGNEGNNAVSGALSAALLVLHTLAKGLLPKLMYSQMDTSGVYRDDLGPEFMFQDTANSTSSYITPEIFGNGTQFTPYSQRLSSYLLGQIYILFLAGEEHGLAGSGRFAKEVLSFYCDHPYHRERHLRSREVSCQNPFYWKINFTSMIDFDSITHYIEIGDIFSEKALFHALDQLPPDEIERSITLPFFQYTDYRLDEKSDAQRLYNELIFNGSAAKGTIHPARYRDKACLMNISLAQTNATEGHLIDVCYMIHIPPASLWSIMIGAYGGVTVPDGRGDLSKKGDSLIPLPSAWLARSFSLYTSYLTNVNTSMAHLDHLKYHNFNIRHTMSGTAATSPVTDPVAPYSGLLERLTRYYYHRHYLHNPRPADATQFQALNRSYHAARSVVSSAITGISTILVKQIYRLVRADIIQHQMRQQAQESYIANNEQIIDKKAQKFRKMIFPGSNWSNASEYREEEAPTGYFFPRDGTNYSLALSYIDRLLAAEPYNSNNGRRGGGGPHPDAHEAMRLWYCLSSNIKCRYFMYTVGLSPDERIAAGEAVRMIRESLGLAHDGDRSVQPPFSEFSYKRRSQSRFNPNRPGSFPAALEDYDYLPDYATGVFRTYRELSPVIRAVSQYAAVQLSHWSGDAHVGSYVLGVGYVLNDTFPKPFFCSLTADSGSGEHGACPSAEEVCLLPPLEYRPMLRPALLEANGSMRVGWCASSQSFFSHSYSPAVLDGDTSNIDWPWLNGAADAPSSEPMALGRQQIAALFFSQLVAVESYWNGDRSNAGIGFKITIGMPPHYHYYIFAGGALCLTISVASLALWHFFYEKESAPSSKSCSK